MYIINRYCKMDFYTCPICNTQVAENQRDYHEMICNNAFREDEFADMIPCEICGRLVNYENYSDHINRCYSFTNINVNNVNNVNNEQETVNNQNIANQVDSAINNLLQIVNNNNIEDSDDDLPDLIDNNDNNILNNNEDLVNIFMNILNTGLPGNINLTVNNQEVDDYTQLTNLSETIGNVEIGIDNPQEYFKKSVNIGFKCPICYNECENTMITSCNHEICEECTKEWYSKNKKCVICMNEIKKL